MADNTARLDEVASAIDEFLAGQNDLDFIQAKLQTTMSLLERPAVQAANAIRLAAPWAHRDEPHDGLTTEERLRQVPAGFQ